jgi:hypothetical protein
MNKENHKVWFIFGGGQVSGPFSADEIKQKVLMGLASDSLIWDEEKGQWEPVKTWLATNVAQEPVRAEGTSKNLWHYAIGSDQNGPLQLGIIIQMVKAGDIPLTAKFWTSGLQQWVGLDMLPQIVEGAGLLRRKNQRVPLVGLVEIKGFPHEQPVTAFSVSEEGVGLQNLTELGAGAKIVIKINSPMLKETVESKAEILIQKDLISSLKFHGLQEKAKQALAQYIKSYKVG